MDITTLATSLEWRTNGKGVWKTLLKDMKLGATPVFSEGYTAMVAGKKVTISNATRPDGTVTYTTDITDAVVGGTLYGAGSAYDSLEAVSGEKTVRMGSVDLGTLNWKTGSTEGYFYCDTLSDITTGISGMVISSRLDVLTSSWASANFDSYPDNVLGKTTGNKILYVKCLSFTIVQVAEFKASLSGVMLYYELAEPTTSTETAQPMSLEQGSDTIGGGSFSATYEGTEYEIQLVKGCRYIHRDEAGVDHYLSQSASAILPVKGGASKVIDLTHWFGLTFEPANLDAFYKLYPTWKNYDIPYIQWAFLNYKGTGVQTIGFNAYNHATGTAELLGGNKYQICGTYTSVSYVDQWGNTEELELDADGIFTPVNNGTLTVVGGNATDTCVHLCWSGYKNFGEKEYQWEPFIKNVHNIDVTQYFPEGMNGINGVYDELKTDSATQNIKKIMFTGAETFAGVGNAGSYKGYQFAVYDHRTPTNSGTELTCNFLSSIGGLQDYGKGLGCVCWSTPTTSTTIWIVPPTSWGSFATTSDIAGFKAKLKELYDAGTPLIVYYISKTPVVTQLPSPINLTYPVNDFGTEQSLPVNTTDLVTTDLHALIRYNTDYMRMNTQLSEIFPTVRSLAQQEQDGEIMKTDATAPNATVGNAYNLIDRNAAGTERQFSFDTAGGTQDIADGTAVAKKVMGTTLNLNQLVKDSVEKTVSSATGVVEVSDAVAGDALALRMTAPRSVVVNQHINATDTSVTLTSGRTWMTYIGGVGAKVTGEGQSVACTGGTDMAVDLTQYFNGDTTLINNITSWDDLVAYDPRFASYVAYNTGTVEGVTPQVKVSGKNLANPQFFVDNGGVLQEDGSYYFNVATLIQGKNIYYNYTNYTGQIAVKYNVKYPSGATANGAYARFVYTDGTTENITGPTEYGSFVAKSSVSNANKVVQRITFTYSIGATATWFKDFQIELGSSATAYEPYHSGGTAQAPAPLFAVGNAADEYEAVQGVTTRKIGVVDLGKLNWITRGSKQGSFSVALSTIKGGLCGLLVSSKLTVRKSAWYIDDFDNYPDDYIGKNNSSPSKDLFLKMTSCATGSDVKTALSGVILYYELATQIEESSTPVAIQLQAGNNTAMQTDGGRTLDTIEADYVGTDYAQQTNASRVYLKVVDGTAERVTGVSSIDVRGGRDNVMDLTRMFGSGLEPGTLDAFYSLFPAWRGYKLPYNEGSLLNFKGTGLKSVGFNLLNTATRTLGAPQNTALATTTVRGPFDETKYYAGLTYNNYYNPANVTIGDVNSNVVSITSKISGYGIAFPLRCIPGQVYRFENYLEPAAGPVHYLLVSYYTYDGTYLEYTTGQTMTAPDNAYWMMICLSTTGNRTITWNNPCLHLQWSGTRNGDYEPYWDYTRPIPTLTYFPNGMNGRGDVYDEINENQAVRRFASIAMDDLDWTDNGNGTFSAPLSSMKSGNPVLITSMGYSTTVSGTVITVVSAEPPVGELVYELAVPVVTSFSEPANMTARISDYGTEECLPANGYDPVTAPFRGIVLYQGDYARTITKLPENYISKESMENLNAQIGPAIGGTITATYNSAEGEYNYSFVRTPTVVTLAAGTASHTLQPNMSYIHAPTANGATYTLAIPSDTSRDNDITVDVVYPSTGTVTFMQGTSVLPLQKTIFPAAGSKWRFLCLWQFDGWKIYPISCN